MNAPIVVTALFGEADFAWLDGLRRAHFPPERNLVPAHLTLFHHLPPSLDAEIRRRLAGIARGPRPQASIERVMLQARGVAFALRSPELEDMRASLADAFAGMLTPQDQHGWRPHVTIQNKVDPGEAKALHRRLSAEFEARPLAIAGLAAWAYRGGPWEPHSRHPFRG
ncbi:MAG: 2'-5' RNA ligase family protein [Parasphingopyxis sp.]|nr:2'-5' RNA ligase family protein [Sphingomonadales bacterium]